MKNKFYIVSWIILGLLFLGMFWLTREDEPKKTTNSDKIEKVAKKSESSSSSSEELVGFEGDIKKAGVFDEFEYNAENDVYIISKEINSTFGDKKGIEYFNSDIRQVLDKGLSADKPVVFRGWFENGGTTVAGSVVYFTTDNFNKDWKAENILDSDIYTKSNGWMSASKFGQYQTSNDKSDNKDIESKLFNIFQLLNEK